MNSLVSARVSIISAILILTAFFLSSPRALLAQNELKAVVVARVAQAEKSLPPLAKKITEIIPDPEFMLKNPNPDDSDLKRAFHMMQAFYTSAGKLFLPSIPVEVECKFADGFFSGFFAEGDNPPALLTKVSAIADKLEPKLTARKVDVKAGVLGGGGIMAFAKGGEWVVLTDEMAGWPRDELAGILAHEICHLEKRDYVKLMLAGTLNQAISKYFPEDKRPFYERLMGLFLTRWQRFSEYETDVQGARLMQRAGFDPRGLIRVLEKLDSPDVSPNQYLKTDHPSSRKRIEAIKRAIAKK